MRLLESFANIVEQDPYRTALLNELNVMSYRDLSSYVDSVVKYLIDSGLKPNDRIGLYFNSSPLHLVACLASLKLGLAQVSLESGGPSQIRQASFERCRVKFILSDFQEDLGIQRLQVTKDILDRRISANELDSYDFFSISGDDPAFLIIGSGTTGHAKVIPISFDNLGALIDRDAEVRNLLPYERHYSMTPFCFYTAKRRSLACLAVGASVVLKERAKPRLGILVDQFALDHLSIAVVHGLELCERFKQISGPRFSRLKSLYVGGSPVSEKLRKELRERVSENVCIAYGSNEFGEACVATADMQKSDEDTLGKPCKGVQLEIVDDEGNECAVGEVGDIRLKGNGQFSAYEDDEEASHVSLRNGWHYPGDLACISESGQVIFKGRSDDVILFDGVKIYPKEVENILENHEAINDVACFACDLPDNQIPLVVFTATGKVETDQLAALYREKMGWRMPKFIHRLEEMPRNAAGKISKVELKEMFSKDVAKQFA